MPVLMLFRATWGRSEKVHPAWIYCNWCLCLVRQLILHRAFSTGSSQRSCRVLACCRDLQLHDSHKTTSLLMLWRLLMQQ